MIDPAHAGARAGPRQLHHVMGRDPLAAEGTRVFEVQGLVHQMAQDARNVWGEKVLSEAAGRRRIIAAEVTATTAKVFEAISGRRPTFTTAPATSKVSGDWPRVLALVFEALFIDASVASQMRPISEKQRPKTGT